MGKAKLALSLAISRLFGPKWSGVPKGVPENQDSQGKLVLVRVAEVFSIPPQSNRLFIRTVLEGWSYPAWGSRRNPTG